MAQYQILFADGTPALHKGDGSPIHSRAPIPGHESLIFDDGGYQVPGEVGYSDGAVRAYVAGLGAGFSFSCMGRSPAAVNPDERAAFESEIRAAAMAKQDPEQFARDEKLRVAIAEKNAILQRARSLNASRDVVEFLEAEKAELIAASKG